MPTPTAYPVTIKIDDVDVTEFVDYRSMAMDDRRAEVSTFEMVVENPSGVTPSMYHDVLVTEAADSTAVIFSGIITELETVKRDNGITVEYNVVASDRKVLLQKSVLPFKLYSASDATILGDLLADAFPDLSSDFDFTSDVSNTTNDLSFQANDISVLDALNLLQQQTGAFWRLDAAFGPGSVTNVVNFEDEGYPYTVISSNTQTTPVVTPLGGSNALYITFNMDAAETNALFLVLIDMGAEKTVTGMTMDVYVDNSCCTDVRWYVSNFDGVVNPQSSATSSGRDGAVLAQGLLDHDSLWTNNIDVVAANPFSFPASMQTIGVELFLSDFGTPRTISVAIDNIDVTTDEGFGEASGNPDINLAWDSTPEAAAFDIDIATSDEFASDITFRQGDYDFNAVIITGGVVDEAVDWTYESDGDLSHINLETPISDYTISVNDGTDGTPNWTAQTVGVWGEDEFTGDGGTADVLYDPVYHWLYFETNPPALSKSVRLEGNIQKPIRVVVDESGSNPTLATVINDPTIKSEDAAFARAQAELERRNQPARLTFKTYEPGLKPGTQINITDTERGLNRDAIIQRVFTEWLGGSGHATFEVECGPNEEPAVDILIADNDRRSRATAAGGQGSVATVQFAALTDDSDNVLSDDNGQTLYEVVE